MGEDIGYDWYTVHKVYNAALQIRWPAEKVHFVSTEGCAKILMMKSHGFKCSANMILIYILFYSSWFTHQLSANIDC